MNRRTALATAGALTIVLLAAAAAVATNLGLLRVTTSTGQFGRLSPADLAPMREVRLDDPAGTATSSDDGGVGARQPTGGEPGDDRSGDRLGRDDAGAGGQDTRSHESFGGREDDD